MECLLDKTLDSGVRMISVQTCGMVCSRQIDIAVKDCVVLAVQFTGGCSGNTQGVASLIKGMTVDEAIGRLDGIDCKGRGTSCPDQLSRALKLYRNKQ